MDVTLLKIVRSPVWALEVWIWELELGNSGRVKEGKEVLDLLVGPLKEELLRQREPSIISGAGYFPLVMASRC